MPVNFNVARVVPTVSRAKASVARNATQNLSGKQISVARKELLEGLKHRGQNLQNPREYLPRLNILGLPY